MTHTTVFHQHSSGNFYHDYESRSSTCNETSSGLEHSLQKNLTLPSHDYMPVTSVLNKIVLIVLIVSNVVKKATKQWAVWKNQYVRETGAGSCQGTNCDQFTPVHCLHSSMRSLWMGSYPVWTLNAPAAFQQSMEEMLGPLRDECCIQYLDDMLCCAKPFDEHIDSPQSFPGSPAPWGKTETWEMWTFQTRSQVLGCTSVRLRDQDRPTRPWSCTNPDK